MTTTQILKKTSLFKALSDDQFKAVVRLSQEKSFQPGEEIFKHGQQAKTLYVLVSGSVSLRTDAPEELDLMAETFQETGNVFGIASLTKSHIYNVTAHCTRSTIALSFDSAGLQEIIRQEPVYGLEVMAELAQLYMYRLNNTRMAVTNLFRIFKSQTHKAEIFDIYGELG
jgi:CRP/FNR family cyclic AMP-dependent transcriptional regulator